jgi:hypothetical protein
MDAEKAADEKAKRDADAKTAEEAAAAEAKRVADEKVAEEAAAAEAKRVADEKAAEEAAAAEAKRSPKKDDACDPLTPSGVNPSTTDMKEKVVEADSQEQISHVIKKCLQSIMKTIGDSAPDESSRFRTLFSIARWILDGDKAANAIFDYSGSDESEAKLYPTRSPLPITSVQITFSQKTEKLSPGYAFSGPGGSNTSVTGVHKVALSSTNYGKAGYLVVKRATTPSPVRSHILLHEEASRRLAEPGRKSIRASSVLADLVQSSYGNGVALGLDTLPLDTLPANLPLTAISVLYPNACEEPPPGFDIVHWPLAKEKGAHAQAKEFVSLGIHKGTGAPISEVALLYFHKKEALPSGWQAVEISPDGRMADLNASGEPHKPHSGSAFLCFKPQLADVLARFKLLLHPAHLPFAQTMAVLVACLYSTSGNLIVTALMAFKTLDLARAPNYLVDSFLGSFCEAATMFLSFRADGSSLNFVLIASLQFLLWAFKKKDLIESLSLDTIMRFIELCFLFRQADTNLDALSSIVAAILARSDLSLECACQIAHRAAFESSDDSSDPAAGSNSPPFSFASTPPLPSDSPFSATREEIGKETWRHSTNTDASYVLYNYEKKQTRDEKQTKKASQTTWCIYCRPSSILTSNPTSPAPTVANQSAQVICRDVLESLIRHVRLSRRMDQCVNQFRLTSGPKFRVAMTEMVSLLLPQCVSSPSGETEANCSVEALCSGCCNTRVMFVFTIMFCKFASVEVPSMFSREKSETLHRKKQGLCMLQALLANSGAFFRRTQSSGRSN